MAAAPMDASGEVERQGGVMTKIALVTLVLCLGVLTAASVGAQAPPPAAPPQIPYGAPITLEQAKKAAAGAEAESRKNNWNMAIVILDTGGNLVLLHRMDQTQIASIEIARQKAWSAVAYRRPTKVFEDGLAQGGLNTRI